MIQNKLPLTYDNPLLLPGRNETVLFPEEYFSGADLSIYVGDVFVSEVNRLQFALTQQIRPIYGYNSYTYDALAVGNRIVQGSFAINFTEPYYLEKLLARAYGLDMPEERPVALPGPESIPTRKLLDDLAFWGIISQEDVDSNQIPDWVMVEIATGAQNHPVIRSIIQGLNDLFLVPQPVNQVNKQKSTPFFRERFDLLIVYGDMPHFGTYAAVLPGENGQVYYADYTGKPEYLSAAQRYLRELGPRQMLVELQITGVSCQTDVSGQPVEEVYSFVAKDLVKQPDILKK